jgi:outer membrane lipoprotein LolB
MISRILFTFWFSIGVFTLAGCSQTTVTKPFSTNPVVSSMSKDKLWKKRQQVLIRDNSWTLKSKIALRFRQDHWTFGLNWVQQAVQQYVMQINNPITGGVVARLSRNKSGVSLLSDNGKIYRDVDEERLLQRQANIRLPVKGMQYWVRGLPYPKYKIDKVVLDSLGRPQSIIQSGWKIDYSKYSSNKFNAMPRKVVISSTKDSVYLKMIAKQWQGI